MTFSLIITCPESSIGHRINLVDSYIMGFKDNILKINKQYKIQTMKLNGSYALLWTEMIAML